MDMMKEGRSSETLPNMKSQSTSAYPLLTIRNNPQDSGYVFTLGVEKYGKYTIT